MKKLSAVLMCMVALLWAAPANAQFKWGLEGGVNLSKASIKGDGGLFDAPTVRDGLSDRRCR